MYLRDQRDKQEIKIPENYAGNAFSRVAETAQSAPAEPIEREPPSLPSIIEAHAEPKQVRQSPFSALFPSSSCSSHFPFGHGIGAEELFILGIMLLVYTSADENQPMDNEMLLLLCILLFSG